MTEENEVISSVTITKLTGGYLIEGPTGAFIETSLNTAMRHVKNSLAILEVNDPRLPMKDAE